jgi:hypothetical protein
VRPCAGAERHWRGDDGMVQEQTSVPSATGRVFSAWREGLQMAVRPEGAKHLWRKNPPRKLSIDLEANERLGRVTGRAGAS